MRWWSCYAACSLTDEEEEQEEFALGGRRMAVSGDSGDYLIGKSDNPTIPQSRWLSAKPDKRPYRVRILQPSVQAEHRRGT